MTEFSNFSVVYRSDGTTPLAVYCFQSHASFALLPDCPGERNVHLPPEQWEQADVIYLHIQGDEIEPLLDVMRAGEQELDNLRHSVTLDAVAYVARLRSLKQAIGYLEGEISEVPIQEVRAVPLEQLEIAECRHGDEERTCRVFWRNDE